MSGYLSFVLLLTLVFYAATSQKDEIVGVDMLQMEEPLNVESVIENADVIIEEIESVIDGTPEVEETCPAEEFEQVEEIVQPRLVEEKPRKIIRLVRSKRTSRDSCHMPNEPVAEEEEVIIVKRPKVKRHTTCKRALPVRTYVVKRPVQETCAKAEEVVPEVPPKVLEEKTAPTPVEEQPADNVEATKQTETVKPPEKLKQEKKAKAKPKSKQPKAENLKQKGQKNKPSPKQSKTGKTKQ